MLQKLLRFSQVSKLEYEEKEEEQRVFNCGILFFIQTRFVLPKGKNIIQTIKFL